MTSSERPPPSASIPPEHDDTSDGPDGGSRDGREGREHRDNRDRARKIVERLLREGVRRAVEKGVEQITETPDNLRQFVHDLKLPREVASVVFQQIDDTKNGLYRAVAREIRDFLGETNIAEELIKALTTLSFEIKTEIRFIPNDQRFDTADGAKPAERPASSSGADRSGPDSRTAPKPDLKAVRPDVKASVRVHGLRDKDNSTEE